MTEAIHCAASSAGLTAALHNAPLHLRPVLEAVRDHGLGLMVVQQGVGPFRTPRPPRRPSIVLIGDDHDTAVGPYQFHMPSVRRSIRSAHAFAVIAGAPPVQVYQAMVDIAVGTRRDVLIVETRVEQEIPWVSLIRKLAPGRPVCLTTVTGGNA